MSTCKITLAVLATALLGAAPAQALTVGFAGSGQVHGPTPTPPAQFNGLSIGPGDANYVLDGVSGWTLDVEFSGGFVGSIENGMLTIQGGWNGTMAGHFARGGDGLYFTGVQRSDSPADPIELTYTITGGTGLYAGYTGSGSSTVVLMGNPFALPTPVPFLENGVFRLQAVSEPGTWTLWLAGLGLSGLSGLGRARGARTARALRAQP